MENRLKYKAWHKKTKQIVVINEIYSSLGIIPKYHCTGKSDFCAPERDIILMPSIGVKDINDNLIYEGFIVKEGDSFIKVIEYDEQYAGYGLDTKAYSYEILGNIYQHKHLLEDAK